MPHPAVTSPGGELDLADEPRLGPMLILCVGAGHGDECEVFVQLRRPAGGKKFEAPTFYVFWTAVWETQSALSSPKGTSKMAENSTQGLDTDAEQERRE